MSDIAEIPQVEFSERQIDLFVHMLEMYLEWAETLPELAGVEELGK